jgi:hypothetical protein
MKLLHILVLAQALTFCGYLNAEIPAELRAIIQNPPTVSPVEGGTHFPKEGGLLIESTDFISFIRIIKKEGTDDRDYEFRTYSKKFKMEITGKGSVFERYYRVSDPNSEKREKTVIDKESKLFIDAGLFKAEWSLGDYLYCPKSMATHEATESDYESRIKN